MKSRKVFAILTLVAFLMTLVPMAAFGAVDPYSTATTSLKATNLSPDTYDGTDADSIEDTTAKFTVTFKDDNGDELTGAAVNFYIKTSRDAVKGWVDQDASGASNGTEAFDAADNAAMKSSDGLAVAATTNADGEVIFYLGSTISGSFTVKVFDSGDANDGAQIGETKEVKVNAGDGTLSLTAYDDSGDDELAVVGGNDGSTEAKAFQLEAGDGIELHAVLEDGANPIEGKTVTFKKTFDGGSAASIGTDVTDDDGEAVLYYEATKSGSYKFTATSGDADDDAAFVWIKYSAGDADTITNDTEDGAKVAVDEDNTITFIVKDEQGNDVSNETVEFDVTSAPADSDFEDFTAENVTTNSDGEAEWTFNPDKVGKYTIKAKVDGTRISKSITVDAMEFGDVVKMELELQNLAGDEIPSVVSYDVDDAAHLAMEAKLDVTLVDANGVELDAADYDDDDLKFASSNIKALTVDGVGQLDAQDEDFAGVVTITVVDSDSNVAATIDVPMVGAPYALTSNVTVTGKTAAVDLQYVDNDGKKTVGDEDETYSIVMPSGVASADVNAFDETGAADFELEAEAYGKYTVTVVTADTHISKSFTVDFVQPASEIPVIGAKAVTMFIGATGYVSDGAAKVSDVAPFIKDGRTFVAVRPLAEAFGATAAWNEATQTVTLTRSDMTVTIQIGSNAISVVKGGVTTTVTADVAAFIQAGRTVLPFRAVGDAFGAAVSYDAATQAVSFTQGK